MAIFWKLSTWF